MVGFEEGAMGLIDLTGQRFGQLTVIFRDPENNPKGMARWRCRCDCGRDHVAIGNKLRSGRSVSCGDCPKKRRGARAEARADGKSTYFTGRPCPHGHISPRSVLDKQCVECRKAKGKTYIQSGYQAEYRAKNIDRIRMRAREWRARNPEAE